MIKRRVPMSEGQHVPRTYPFSPFELPRGHAQAHFFFPKCSRVALLSPAARFGPPLIQASSEQWLLPGDVSQQDGPCCELY